MTVSARSVIVDQPDLTPDEWRIHAACLGRDDLMFDPTRTEEALNVCRDCRVLDPCRQSVMADVKLRRAYAAVEAVIGGLPPAQLRRRRKSQPV